MRKKAKKIRPNTISGDREPKKNKKGRDRTGNEIENDNEKKGKKAAV